MRAGGDGVVTGELASGVGEAAEVTEATEPRVSRLARALPLLLAAVLAVAALGTVGSAGCDEPARYVSTPDGVELVGGCLSPADVHPVADPEAHDPAADRG